MRMGVPQGLWPTFTGQPKACTPLAKRNLHDVIALGLRASRFTQQGRYGLWGLATLYHHSQARLLGALGP